MASLKMVKTPGFRFVPVFGILLALLLGAPQAVAAIPNAPTNPNATGITTTGANLGWTDNANDEQAFVLQITLGSLPLSEYTLPISNPAPAPSPVSFPVPDGALTPNMKIVFAIAASNADGQSAFSPEHEFWTLAETPPAPVVGLATPTTLNVTVVPAAENPDATEYAIRCTSSSQWVQADGTLGAAAVWQTAAVWDTIQVTGLTTSTPYTFAVRARNGGGVETANGPTATGTPLPTPDAPTNLTVTDVGADSVSLEWDDNSDDESGFRLYAGLGVDPPATAAGDLPADTVTVTLPLGANLHLSLNIAAFNDNGESDRSNTVTFWTLAEVPSAPVVDGATNNSLNVAIGPRGSNPDETEYAIQCTTTGDWVQADGSLGAAPVWQTAMVWDTVTVTGLTPDTTYVFAVTARNGEGTETAQGPTAGGATLVPVTVPDVVNEEQGAAESIITDAGLVPSVTTQYSMTVDAGKVISTSPVAGTEVGLGSTVVLYVSEGPNPNARQVPDVVGKSQAEAEADLADVDLVPNVVRAFDPVVPAGDVISTDPVAGEWLLAGDSVTVTVSDGPEPPTTTVPDVVGFTQGNAEAALLGANLVPAVELQYSDTVPVGEVIATDPLAGATVYEGSTVTLFVSKGADLRPAAPTNLAVTDLSPDSVTFEWTDNSSDEDGFNLYAGPGTEPPATLVTPLPADLTSLTAPVTPNIQLTVQISAFNANGESDRSNAVTFWTLAETPPAPQVGGATMTSLNVTVDPGENPSDTEFAIWSATTLEWVQADGTRGAAPVWQTAGAWDVVTVTGLDTATLYAFAVSARNGAAVETALGPEGSGMTQSLVAVPDVVGQTEANAVAAIEGVGLFADIVPAYSATVAAGLVISTDPAAGAEVGQGSLVTVNVSQGPAPVEVPDLVGQTQATAVSVLGALNLVPNVVLQYSDTVPLGVVISTNPGAGVTVAPGSTVIVTVSDGPEPILVPDVVGLAQGAAQSAVTTAGLLAEIEQQFSDDVPAGFVIATDPVAGTPLSAGSTVVLYVSQGPAPVTVPDVVGETLETAGALLAGVGLAPDVSYAYSLTVPEGTVISSDPAGGTEVQPGTTVALVVSQGPPPAVVPDVRNFTQVNAVSAIEDLNLVAVVEFANSITVPAGLVISTDPAGGAVVPEGTTVTILVSLGPALTNVPEVVGLAQDEAEEAVLGANLVPNVVFEYNDTVAAGLVISTDPTGGTEVFEGATVTVTVSLGRLATVPEVVGLTREEAETAILDEGLVPDVVLEYSDTVAAGVVISTDPAGGTDVPEGTTVTVTVSLGKKTTVPPVVGETRENAEAAILEANLVADVVLEYSMTVPAGVVISTDPEGGTDVPEGTTVTVTVSNGPAPTTVPDVVGLLEFNAGLALEAAALVVGNVVHEYNDTVPLGQVISQNPEAGLEVLSGSAVDLVVSRGPIPVPVPYVVGESLENAGVTLAENSLVVGTVTRVYSPTVPEDEVISQSPIAGTEVLPGTAVDLVVSRGPQPVPVPNVVGQTQAFAQSAITDAGLATGVVSLEYDATVPTGRVISQSPVADTEVLPGTAVDLVVSRGPQPVPVPNVTGLTESAAGTALVNAGLALGTVTRSYNATVPAGQVISQNPAAGSEALPGTAVDITVSRGPQPVAVPNVTGLTQAAAQLSITGAGLAVGDVTQAHSATVPAGRVISQNPASGTQVLPGTAVALVISRGPQPPKVPNVLGLTQTAAQTAITAAGLTVGAVSQDYSAAVPAGLVISQNPAAGIEVATGSMVDFVVSLGPQPVPVPDLLNLTQTAAQAALANAGLVRGVITEGCSDGVAVGRIFGQNPVAGSLALPGSAVAVWVSIGPCTVVVPDVIGALRADAVDALAGAGLVAGTVTEVYNEITPAGRVISQAPASGARVVPGTPVSLVLSLGPEPVPVPDVVGMTRSNADTALAGGRMTTGTVTEQCSAAVAAGRVISQTPAAGALAVPGTGVALVLSTGPCQVVVPNVTGLNLVQALNALTGAELVSGTVAEEFNETVPLGQVISQSPAAGVTVVAGSAVDIVLSKGPAPLTPEEAKELLGDLFDEADTNGDGRLSFAEAQAVLAALTLDVFAELDLNGDGSLDREELGLPDIDDGCFNCNNGCNKGGYTPERLKKRLGDLFLTGLALSALALLGRSRLG